MATTTQIADRIERSLSALRAEVDWLPNTVTEWETTSESERVSIHSIGIISCAII